MDDELGSHIHHRGMFLIGTRGIERNIGGLGRLPNKPVREHVGFDFLTTDVGKHGPVDDHTGRQRLTAELLHLEPITRVQDDVPIREGESVFVKHGANAAAPPAMGFQVSCDF